MSDSLRPENTPKVGNETFTPTVKKGRGRPSFQPSDEQRHAVSVLAGAGTRHDLIAKAFHVTVKTLKRHFPRELREGRQIIDAMVGKRLIEKALAGDTTSIIWYEKTRLGYHERMDLQHGINGVPVDPPRLGISFENGASGRPGNATNTTAIDDVTATAGPLDPPRELPRPQQDYLPRPVEHDPKPAPRSTWEILAMTPQEFVRLKGEASADAALDAELRHQHTHTPQIDSWCAGCRQLVNP